MNSKISFLAFCALIFTLPACGKFQTSQDLKQQSSDAPLAHAKIILMGAMGDSISRGMSILSAGVESVDDNWSSGSNLSDSHLHRLRNLLGPSRTIVGVNVAVSGASVNSSNMTLQGEATQLSTLNLSYVTLEIGANDICQGKLATSTAVAEFQNRVTNALQLLTHGANPPRVISVASIPHIWSLTQIPQLSSNSICQMVWNITCPNLSIGQAQFEAQWVAANQALANAAAASGSTVIFDGGAVSNTVFAADDVALDCFHPSVRGQSKIANAIWMTVSSALNNL